MFWMWISMALLKILFSRTFQFFFLFLWGLHCFIIWSHIVTVPACTSGNLTMVLPHWNAMTQKQDMTHHSVIVYWHKADLYLCNQFVWNVKQESTTTHLNFIDLDLTWPRNPSRPSTHKAKVLLYCYRVAITLSFHIPWLSPYVQCFT